MSNLQSETISRLSSRREFLQTAAAGAALAAVAVPFVHAAGDDKIKVGVIGCGGRGGGAAENCVDAAENVQITALGDAFQDRLDERREKLLKNRADKVDLPKERCFVGLDAYKKVLETDVDLVILATPPGFRPIHLKAAIAANKHIFTEKPVAVDGPGVRTCLEVFEAANKKKRSIVAGTQRRHHAGYLETIKRIHEGAIGDIVAARCAWNMGSLWFKARKNMKDLEWQLRNWLYFTWLSGDHIVEQHVHNLDVINWALKAHPVRCMGMGGRQVRTGPEFGHIFDHFAIDYEYPKDVHMLSMCRQIGGCEKDISESLVGSKGTCRVSDYSIRGEKEWKFEGKKKPEYVQEHTDLIESIRKGEPLNELKTVAESTLTAIMGRMSAYTGKAISWEDALNSKEDLMPKDLDWNMKLDVPKVAMPGKDA